MVRAKDLQKGTGTDSPRGEVGEIDTRAPFRSVKAAVSLFGAVSKDKPALRRSKLSSENVLDKETQLLLSQRELNKYKQKLDSAETTKTRVNSELELAKRTLNDLTTKLETVNASKKSAIEDAEAVKEKAKQLEVAKSQELVGNAARKRELDQARQQYRITIRELDAAKQQLTKIRQDFDAALESKAASFQQAAEAQRSANTSSEKAGELSKEIRAMRESCQQLKLASVQGKEQQAKTGAEKDSRIQVCKAAKEEAEKSIEVLKKEYDPDMMTNLEAKLTEATSEIEFLQQEMRKAHASEMDRVKFLTTELNEATKALQEVAAEESSLRNLVTSLKQELENLKWEKAELLEKEAELEFAAKEKETESARQEAEELMRNAEELRQQAKSARLLAQDAEGKLEVVLKEAEEAKAAEKKAHDDIKMLSEKEKAEDHDSHKITIPKEEFETLKMKAEKSESMADAKVADAIAQLEVIKARKSEAETKLEANLKAVEEIKEATDMALKSAEMAEAAQNTIEGQLQKWRHAAQTMTA